MLSVATVTSSNAAKRWRVEAVLNVKDGQRLSKRQAVERAGVSNHLRQIVRRERAGEQ